MTKQKKFLDVYNDYSAIEGDKNFNQEFLYHYTNSPEAVLGICNGDKIHDPYFRATELKEFWNKQNDPEEGRLFIEYLKHYFEAQPDESLKSLFFEVLNNENQNEDYHLDSIMEETNTEVLCTCLNSDLENMWRDYSGARDEKAMGYKLVLNKEKLLTTLYIKVNGEEKRKSLFGEKIFKFTPIIYNKHKQEEIIKRFADDFLNSCDIGNLEEGLRVRYLILHSEFLSIAFKNGDKFKDEKEYRIWVNIANLDELKPEEPENENGKAYFSFYFDPDAIEEIVCLNEDAKKKIEKDIHDIKLSVKA